LDGKPASIRTIAERRLAAIHDIQNEIQCTIGCVDTTRAQQSIKQIPGFSTTGNQGVIDALMIVMISRSTKAPASAVR